MSAARIEALRCKAEALEEASGHLCQEWTDDDGERRAGMRLSEQLYARAQLLRVKAIELRDALLVPNDGRR